MLDFKAIYRRSTIYKLIIQYIIELLAIYVYN